MRATPRAAGAGLSRRKCGDGSPRGSGSCSFSTKLVRLSASPWRVVTSANKTPDLVPKDNAQAWLRYLRHSTPTLPFRSAANNQRSNLSSTTAPALVKLLKAYRPSVAAGAGKQAKQSVTVGVVGYPNVGKSSLINSLKRSRVRLVGLSTERARYLTFRL